MKVKVRTCIIFFCTICIFAVFVSHMVSLERMQQQVAGKVIRFHVLANSDSDEDQALKLAVRDQVGSYLGSEMEQVEDIVDGREIIRSHLEEIEACAESVIAEHGYDYPVTASLEKIHFPIKVYGRAVFPAGRYEALRIVIGEGEGQNWWCVLYPNLCFSGSMYQIDETAAARELQAVLTPEEYQMIMENKEYQVRFRFQEAIKGIFTNP